MPTVHESYEELVADPEIDAVYNPLPNSHHFEWSRRALQAGKHVLCEKPLTANAAEARRLATTADEVGLVLMEAFHYRYHPLMRRAIEVVRDGELGAVERIEAWMQIPLLPPGDIRYRSELAGGATMDVGSYTVHMLRTLAGTEPEVVSARARLRRPGVDRWMQAELRFPGGCSGRMTCSLFGARLLKIALRVTGDEGELRITNPTAPQYFHRFSLTSSGRKRRERFGKRATYAYQLDAFSEAAETGRPPLTGPADAVANMEVIDAIYRAAGLEPRCAP